MWRLDAGTWPHARQLAYARFFPTLSPTHLTPPTVAQGVRFKRVIMDESSTDRSFTPPQQPDFKRMVFCSGKVRGGAVSVWVCACVMGLSRLQGGQSSVDTLAGRHRMQQQRALLHLLCCGCLLPAPMPLPCTFFSYCTLYRIALSIVPPSTLPVPQVYYELAAERAKQGKQGEVALIRMEQMAPFPFDLVMREMRRFPNAGGCAAGGSLAESFVLCVVFVGVCGGGGDSSTRRMLA